MVIARTFRKKAQGLIFLLFFPALVQADYKSTFLINGAQYSTLSWLSNQVSNDWRDQVIARIKQNGDTHADLMARSTARDFGVIDGVDRNSWRNRLVKLRNSGIQPVVWLISDDSPDVYAKGLSNQIAYQNSVVAAVDDLVSHYVVCLECDEYYSPAQVSQLIAELRKKVDKPIGVHLTPKMIASRNTPALKEYFKNADIIYLQTGWANQIGEAEFRKRIEYAITFGKPVVVSEYHLQGTSPEAKRYGDIACSYYQVVGTGNGRNQTMCSSLVWEEKKEESFHKKYGDQLITGAIVALAIYSVLNYQAPVTLSATESTYLIGLNLGKVNILYSEEMSLVTYTIRF
jgi:hypothetical protein